MTTQKNTSLYLLMVNMFIAMLGIGLIIPVLPDYLAIFNADDGKTAGYLVAAFGLTQFIFSPISGEWSDKYGRKRMIVLGLLLFAISNLIFAVATSVWMLYLSRLIGGISAASMIPSMMAYVADTTTEEGRGKGMGVLGAAMSLGFVIGPGIGGFLAEMGVRAPFYVSAGLGAVALIGTFLFLPESLSREAVLANRSRAANAKKENIVTQFARSFKGAYFIPLLLIFTLTFGLANFEAIFPLFSAKNYGFDTRDISILITVGALVGTIIQLAVVHRLIMHFGEKKLINATFVLAGITMVAMLLSGNFIYMLVMIALFFTFTSIMRPAINTLLSKMAGNEQGFVAGMNNAYMSIGNILGPSLAGILFDVHLDLPYAFGAVVLFISFAVAYVWGKKQGPAASKEADTVPEIQSSLH